MIVIVMAETINMFVERELEHKLKQMESGSVAITPKVGYVVIDYGN